MIKYNSKLFNIFTISSPQMYFSIYLFNVLFSITYSMYFSINYSMYFSITYSIRINWKKAYNVEMVYLTKGV